MFAEVISTNNIHYLSIMFLFFQKGGMEVTSDPIPPAKSAVDKLQLNWLQLAIYSKESQYVPFLFWPV